MTMKRKECIKAMPSAPQSMWTHMAAKCAENQNTTRALISADIPCFSSQLPKSKLSGTLIVIAVTTSYIGYGVDKNDLRIHFFAFLSGKTLGHEQKNGLLLHMTSSRRFDPTLGTYDLAVKPLVFICINLRPISNEAAEFGDVFDCGTS
jgi:hypothetical protein